MFGIIAIFIPILVTDVINPVLLAAEIFALSSRRPYFNGFFLLFGWFIVYFISGIILAFGLEAIKEFLSNPRPIDFYIETVVALLLIWLAIRIRRTGDHKRKKKEFDDADALKPTTAFWAGASINLIGLPFAIPYFAAIDQILKADATVFYSLFLLFTYNLLYVLPFLVILLLRMISGSQVDGFLEKVNNGMEKVSNWLMPLLLLGLAGLLLTDAVLFFCTGEPLF